MMPTYNFLIKCTECDGQGEYETSMNPDSPIYTCENCEEGWNEVTESFDCITDLKEDYPDAVDILTDDSDTNTLNLKDSWDIIE